MREVSIIYHKYFFRYVIKCIETCLFLPFHKPFLKNVWLHPPFPICVNPRIKLVIRLYGGEPCCFDLFSLRSGGNVSPLPETANKIIVLSLSHLVIICNVGCPFKETTLIFLSSWGTPVLSAFKIKSGRYFRPKFSIVSSRIPILWLILKEFLLALWRDFDSFVAFFRLTLYRFMKEEIQSFSGDPFKFL